MSQNYNVDDILEEIRRKKTGQPDPPPATYDSPRGGYARGGEPPSREDSAPPGMPKVRPIGTRRPAAAQPRQRAARQEYDDSGWGEPAPRQPAAPARRAAPAYDEAPRQERRRQPAPSAPARRQDPPAAGGLDFGEPVRRWKEPSGGEAVPRRRESLYREPDSGEPAPARKDYCEDPAPRRRDTAEEAPVRRRPAYGEPPRQSRAPASCRKQEPRRETPPRGRQEAPAYGTRQEAPRGGQPRRNSYGAEYDAPEEIREPYPDLEMERFEDDAPPETPTEDFSIHFSLDDTAQGQGPGFSAAESARDDGESLVKSRWHQSFLEQEMQEQPMPDDDFAMPEDAPLVERDLKRLKTGLIVRTVSMAVLVFLTTYLVFSIKYPPFGKLLGESYASPDARLPLYIPLIYPDAHPRIFMTVLLLLCAVGALICANIIGTGFGALFRLRANSDTPAALAVLAVLVQGVILMIYPSQLMAEEVSVYIPAAMLVLLFTLIGKLMLAGRIGRNFRYLTGDKEKYAMLSVVNHDFARELSRGLGPEIDEVSYSAKADFITGFLYKSYSGDYSDNFYCVSAPVSFLGALLVGGVTGFLSKSPVLAVSSLAATMCVCAPLSSAIVPHLMLGRMSKWLCKRGAMLAGYETAEEISAAGAVMIDEKDVFPGESVQLHGMKVFAEKRIDEAILDAASVILSCSGLMSGVFLNMIGGNQRMLKQVDGLIYEDGMGVSAWVDGKRVLIGSRELMQNHEVECPSRDFETRYTRGGRRVLYIANSGELSAMFVVSYNGEMRTAERLADLERRGVGIILYTTDPNVTSELVSSVFGIRKGSVRVLPAKLHPEYNYLTRIRDRVTAGCAHQGGLAGILQLLRASASVCRSVRAGAITQLVGIIAGYGLMAAMAFTGALSAVSFYMVMLYGLCALAVTFIVSNFGKM